MARKSVARAAAILNEFSVEDPVLGVTELGKRLGMTKSSVHYILRSLKEGGLVEQDPVNAKYRLGRGLLGLVYSVVHSDTLLRIAEPLLTYLAERLGEAAHLVVREGDEALILWRVLSPVLREQVVWTGRKPLHSTAWGKVLLAQMDEKELEALLDKGLARYTDNTITDPTRLGEELKKVREQGFAVSFGEQESGVNAVAVPVAGPDGQTVAALGVVGRGYTLTREQAFSSVERLQAVSAEITRKLA